MSEHSTRDRFLRTVLPLTPIALALFVIWLLPRIAEPPTLVDVRATPDPIVAHSPEELQTLFAARDFHWPPEQTIPPVSVQRFPDGLEDLRVDERKSLFFRTLLPLVLLENERILAKRDVILSIHQRLSDDPAAELDSREEALLDHVWERYRMEGDFRDGANRERLLRRLDVIPPSLALAQAANESGWGTSRFTREANNLFGEWTWDENVGLLPRQRREGATHFVRVFPDLHSSVRSYVHNLNIGHAYTLFRQMRAEIRQEGRTPDGLTLAAGLERYSERGQDYIREVRAMIRQNELQDLPEELRLSSDQ
ncbi:glucosaminidase domain-containing protein [Natronospira bacteriovora]|uniref:Glucosaminidase domain-containing protein n=1 Tax=Natronospira bacteriovora TaxID=3069753 RepID=A0ABU0W3I0_9GAMM|nr:glucosaminidase domain-containing protein [Natronospira sp. AB-CW4]MDQ2068519.1 glucosaminidase domain-containing protein [Natronospira sp. AB-CW4]